VKFLIQVIFALRNGKTVSVSELHRTVVIIVSGNRWCHFRFASYILVAVIVKAKKPAYYGHTMRKPGSCLEKEIMQGTVSGAAYPQIEDG